MMARSLIALRVNVSDDVDEALIALCADIIVLECGEYSTVLFNEVTAVSETTAIEKRPELDEAGCYQRRINVLQSELSNTRRVDNKTTVWTLKYFCCGCGVAAFEHALRQSTDT